jgi:hypothetical protein
MNNINIDLSQIVNQVIANFDFVYMLVINIFTFTIIKTIDTINGDKAISTWTKRIVLLIAIVIVFIGYKINNYPNNIVLINSTIAAPVFWSWVLKPILNKFNINYNKDL